MPTSRREFLIGLAASGAIVTVPSPRRANANVLSTPMDLSDFGAHHYHGATDITNIKIGYSAIAWHDQDAKAIQDISALGAPGIQLRANALQEFPDPHALRDLLGNL